MDSLLSSVGINSSKVSSQTASAAPAKNKPKALAKEQPPQEVDEMLSDLLADMDSAGPIEPEGDMIPEEDIENIFEEAEAYATLLGKQEENKLEEVNNTNENLFNIENNIPEPVEEQPVEQPAPSIPDENGEELIDVEWKNGEASAESQADVDALFMDIDSGLGPDAREGLPEQDDSELHMINESLQGENADMVSPHAAFSDFSPINEEISVQPKKKKKKPGFFQRLFGNINEDVTPEMIEADRRAKQEEEEKALQAKEEKKRLAEEKKAEAEAEKARKKAEADAERNRKMALAMEKKAAAKEKEKQKREAALAIAEYEVEHGKINKAGATILFVIFAVLTIVIIIGSNIYSYNLSIKNAQEDFNVQKYNEAYYEVYGLKIKDEDIELYDRIMTVMFVNHQLNSYEYYMTSNNREKALDSLLKGLQRYEKYLQLAQILNITDDLNYVKSEILTELKDEFNMSEAEAYSLVEVDDSVDYSEYIYSLLGEYEGLDILE